MRRTRSRAPARSARSRSCGAGDGTFAARVDTAAGEGPISLAIGDLTGDGRLDVAVSDYEGGALVLPGTGTGSFATPVTLGPIPGNLRGIAIGDVNGDGKLDVAVAHFYLDGKLDIAAASYGANDVSILFGTGGGAFAAPIDYAVGTAPVALVLGDWNGDGKVDIATANLGSNNVSMLLAR